MSHKPFPSRVRWWRLWKHRWTILDLLNQIAYGDEDEAIYVANYYGGSDDWGRGLREAALDVIEVR